MFLWCLVIENDSSQVVHQVLCLKMEPVPASEMLCFFKKFDDGQGKKKKRLYQLTSLMLCSLWFFYPYPETSVSSFHSRLHNISEKHRFSQHNLVKQVLVWLCMVWFRAIWFGTSYANLRRPHKFNNQLNALCMSLLQCGLHPPYSLSVIALHFHQHLTLFHLTASVVTLIRVVIPVCFFSMLFHVIPCSHNDLFRPVLSMNN